MDNGDNPSGLLMGGADSGKLFVWNPDKIIKNEDALVHTLEKHNGAVRALDANPFQVRLLYYCLTSCTQVPNDLRGLPI